MIIQLRSALHYSQQVSPSAQDCENYFCLTKQSLISSWAAQEELPFVPPSQNYLVADDAVQAMATPFA